jgi:hypothetical protein
MTNADDFPKNRFACVRLPDAQGHSITMTFLDGQNDDTPAEHNGVVEHIARHDSDKAARAVKLLTYLRQNEETVMRWLEADPANSTAFAKDPIGALRQILPDAPLDID